jgi:hypothetical protein
MTRDLALALLALLTLFTPPGPVGSLATIALVGVAVWTVIDRLVDVGMSFWNRWISP